MAAFYGNKQITKSCSKFYNRFIESIKNCPFASDFWWQNFKLNRKKLLSVK